MQGNQNFDNDVIVGNRYRLRDMIAHQSHMITCVLLIITGLYMAIQFNTCSLHAWELMSFQTYNCKSPIWKLNRLHKRTQMFTLYLSYYIFVVYIVRYSFRLSSGESYYLLCQSIKCA